MAQSKMRSNFVFNLKFKKIKKKENGIPYKLAIHSKSKQIQFSTADTPNPNSLLLLAFFHKSTIKTFFSIFFLIKLLNTHWWLFIPIDFSFQYSLKIGEWVHLIVGFLRLPGKYLKSSRFENVNSGRKTYLFLYVV